MSPEPKDDRIEPRTVLIEAEPSRIEIAPLGGGAFFLAINGTRLRIQGARMIEVRRP